MPAPDKPAAMRTRGEEDGSRNGEGNLRTGTRPISSATNARRTGNEMVFAGSAGQGHRSEGHAPRGLNAHGRAALWRANSTTTAPRTSDEPRRTLHASPLDHAQQLRRAARTPHRGTAPPVVRSDRSTTSTRTSRSGAKTLQSRDNAPRLSRQRTTQSRRERSTLKEKSRREGLTRRKWLESGQGGGDKG